MTIFERIRNKAQQAIQGVGNFIDRDKTQQGVQLAPGGLMNRVTQNFSAPNLRQMGSNISQAAVPGGVGAGVNRVTQNFQNPFTQMQQGVSPLNTPLPPVVKQSAQALGGLGNFLFRDTPQGVARSGAGLALSGMNLLQRPQERFQPEMDVSSLNNPIANLLWGKNETIRTPKGTADFLDRGSRDFSREQLGQEMSVPYPLLMTAGLAAPISDLLPGGAGAKSGVKTGAKTLTKGTKAITKNTPTFARLLENANAQKIIKDLDFLPKYADELGREIDQLTGMVRNHKILSKVDNTIPAKTKLQSILKQKKTELRGVTKQISEITSQKAPTNQATMIAGEKGIIPLKEPLNSTQQLDDIITKTADVKTGGAPKSVDEILQLPAPKDTLSLPLGERSVTIKQLRKLVDQGGSLDGVKINAKTAKEAREAIRLGVNADNVVPTWVKGSGKASETLFDANGNILKELPENQQTFDFAREASEETLNVGNRFTRWGRKMLLDTEDNLRRTFKDSYTQFEPIMSSFKTRIAEGSKWVKGYQDEAVKIVGDLKIKVGGEEDKLIRLFQQKNGVEKVVQKVGPERAAQLEQAYTFLRTKYDEIFEFVNTKRKAAGLTPLPYQGDTFLSQQGGKSGSMFDSLLEGLPKQTDTSSSTIFKKQKADATTGAFESFAKYLESAQKAGFTDLSGQEIRDAANRLSEMGGNKQAVDQLYKFSQDILGDKEINPVLKTIENITGKMAGAKVLGKVSTLASQFLSLPQAIGRDPIAFIGGNINASKFKNLRTKSEVLDVVSQTLPRQLRTGNAYTKSVGFAGDVLVKGQDIANRLIYNGFLDRGLKKGLSEAEAVKWADDQLVKIVGDRRLGMSPQAYSTFIGKIFGRFTIEPTAASVRLVKDIGEKKFGAVLGTLVAWHVGNKINEKYGTGFSPFIDPWEAIKDSAEFAVGTDEVEQDKLKAVTRLVSESLKTMPMIQNMFNTSYSLGETFGMLPKSDDVMGEDNTWMNAGSLYNPLANVFGKDADGNVGINPRPITGNKAVDVPWNVASNTLPFFEQGARTTQAANTLNRGYAETKSGSPMYEAPTGLDAGRSLLFGQSSSQNSRDFFDKDGMPWLSDRQKETMDRLGSKEEKLDFLRTAQGQNQNVNKIKNSSMESVLDSGKPGSEAEQKALKEYVNTALKGGVTPSDNDMKYGLFNGYTATSKSIEERTEVYKALNSTLKNEYLTPEQRQAVIKASGADPKNVEYYTLASKDQDVRLQEMLPKLDNMESEAMMEYLMSGRRVVGGKQLVSNSMVDYLYEMDYISDSQKKAIKALKYDEINDKFYYSKSYKGGGRMSFSQAEKLYKMSLPKFSNLKSMDLLLSPYSGGTAQTNAQDDRLLSSILKAPIQKNTNNNLWF